MLAAPLPAPRGGAAGGGGLADVLSGALDAVLGRPAALDLPRVSRAVVMLVDGLGVAPLRARAGHARTLAGRLGPRAVIDAGFPTTTASALATLATGTHAGEHGLVGYSVLDTAHDRVVNQLNGWGARLDPATWQRAPTVFDRAAEAGVPAHAVGPERYRDSGFTAAVLRGAQYTGAQTVEDRIEAALDLLADGGAALVYLYVPELDKAGHARGSGSGEWTDALEQTDAATARLVAGLGRDEGLLITADHGMIDVPAHAHVLFDETPGLLDGVRHVAGEPRCLQLHLDAGAPRAHRAALVERWRAAEGERAWIATRDDAVAAGWFGPAVHPDVLPRIGDVLVAARRRVAYYDGRITERSGRGMVGQHGSFAPEETRIPLLRYGAFAD